MKVRHILLIAVIALTIVSCSKEKDSYVSAPTATTPDFAPSQVAASQAVYVVKNNQDAAQKQSLLQFIQNLIKHPQPTTMYLNFTGETGISGTPWGINGTFSLPSAGLTAAQIAAIKSEFANDLWFLNVNVVTDRASFNRAKGSLRQEFIMSRHTATTDASPALSQNAGIVVSGSLFTDGASPAFLFVDPYGDLTNAANLRTLQRKAVYLVHHCYGMNDDNELNVPGDPSSGFFQNGGTAAPKFPGGGPDFFEFGDLAGSSQQTLFARYGIGYTAAYDNVPVANSVADSMIATSGWRIDIVNGLSITLPLTLATKMDLGILKSTDHQYITTNITSAKTATLTSGGSLDIYVDVRDAKTKAVISTVHVPESLTQTVHLTLPKGVKSMGYILDVYTKDDPNHDGQDYLVSPVGGNYSVAVTNG